MSEEVKEVLVFGEIKHALDVYEKMKSRYTIREFNGVRETFLQTASDYDNVIGVLVARGADSLIGKVDHELINALSLAINSIIVIGDAQALVDVKAATEIGIFVADTKTDPKLGDASYGDFSSQEEKEEDLALVNLDFALITGVPQNPVNPFDKVVQNQAEKAEKLVANSGGLDIDISDIQIEY